ncbi:MAG: TonB-dependent receptor plug domain-containing protein [Pseudomonadota bacterium]|nr:TonB-dependent receptor plug domain-containing protein [Pseudomonadota bacterium]
MSQQKLPRLSCIAVALAACLAAPSAFSRPADGGSHASSKSGTPGISGQNQQDQNNNDSTATPTPPTKAKAKQLQQVVVTGTLLPIDPEAAAVPVTTLDATELGRTGVTSNMLDTLRKAVPAFAGRSNAGASNAQNHNQFTAGGSQIELRNLPTLVLLNGQRLALDGVAGLSGSKNFVDVSQIPAAALERVDVLTDGASSLYGADAVGGVVNFVLKHDYHGVTAGGQYGVADGGYHDRSVFVTVGGDVGPVNITATASYSRTSPLFESARSFTSPQYGVTPGTGLPGVVDGGGYVLAPGLLTPPGPTGTAANAGSYAALSPGVYSATSASQLSHGFDYSKYAMLLQQEEHKNFVANITSQPFFDGRVTAFGDILLSQNKVRSTAWQAAGQPFSFTSLNVPAGSPYNPLTTDARGVTFADMSRPKQVFDTTNAYRFSAGLKGDLSPSWTWQTSVNYSESKVKERDTQLLFRPNLAPAVAGGYDVSGNAVPGGDYSKVYGGYSLNNALVLQPALNPFAVSGNPAAALDNIFGTEVLDGDSKLYSWDAHVVGNLFKLPAGSVNVAVGVSWRHEGVSGHADPNGRVTDPVTGATAGNAQNWIGGLYTDPFSHGRNVSAAYVETLVPITSSSMHIPGLHRLEVTLASRFEHYSDAGNGTSPKLGFRWEPFDRQFVIHATYTKSFAAPPLYQAYGPFDTRPVTDRLIGIVFGGRYAVGNSFNGQDGVNPSLKPSTAQSRSIGFEFHPNFISGLTVTADYSSIKLSGFPGGADFTRVMQSVNDTGSASPYFDSVSTGNFTNLGGTAAFGTPGSLLAFLTNPVTGQPDPSKYAQLYVIDRFRNQSALTEHSWLLGLDYILPWNQHGTWELSSKGTIFNSFKFQRRPGDPSQEYAGNASNIGVFAGTLPKYRFYSTLDWSNNNLDITLANTFISSVNDAGAAGTLPGIRVPSYSVWDLRGSYTWMLGTGGSDRELTLALGVNNIGNTMPPIFPRAFTNQFTTSDIGTYSPIGRLVYGSLRVSF